MIFLFNIHEKYSFIYMYLVKRHNKILKTGVFYQTLKIDSLPYGPYHLNNATILPHTVTSRFF